MLSKYAGQPQPDLNLCEALYSGAAQAAHVYTPDAGVCLSYTPVNGGSVPFCRRIRNCSVGSFFLLVGVGTGGYGGTGTAEKKGDGMGEGRGREGRFERGYGPDW